MFLLRPSSALHRKPNALPHRNFGAEPFCSESPARDLFRSENPDAPPFCSEAGRPGRGTLSASGLSDANLFASEKPGTE